MMNQIETSSLHVIGYTRVSTSEQANEGVSLDAQEERITAYCKAHGMKLVQMYVDAGLSGRKAHNRPALQSAIDHACREKAVLFVFSLSRLARSTRDAISIAERLSRAGAQLVSLSEKIDTTTATGKMFFRMMSVLAEFESDQISERVKTAVTHNKQHGKRYCNLAPFGYQFINGTIVENVEEQTTIAHMRLLLATGLSFRRVARELTNSGILGRNGNPIPYQHVIRIVRRKPLLPQQT